MKEELIVLNIGKELAAVQEIISFVKVTEIFIFKIEMIHACNRLKKYG